MWAPVIAALLQYLLPILAEAFKEWLERRLKSAAESLPHPAYVVGDGASQPDRVRQLVLLDAVYDSLWFFQFAKKAAVLQCIDAVERGYLPAGSNKIEG